MLYNVNLEKYLNSKEQYIITFLCTTHIQISTYSFNFVSGGGKKDSLYYCNHHKFLGEKLGKGQNKKLKTK